jgi:hypothetical protein
MSPKPNDVNEDSKHNSGAREHAIEKHAKADK